MSINFNNNQSYVENQENWTRPMIRVNIEINGKCRKVNKIVHGIGHAMLGVALLTSAIAVDVMVSLGVALTIAVFWPAVFISPVFMGACLIVTLPAGFKTGEQFAKAFIDFSEI